MIRVPKQEAYGQLQELLQSKPHESFPQNVRNWRTRTSTALAWIFGDGSWALKQFERIGFEPFAVGLPNDAADPERQLKLQIEKAARAGLSEAETLLRQLLTHVSLVSEAAAPQHSPHASPPAQTILATTNSVFIVHGHDTPLANAVARYIQKLGLEEIILREQPNKGLTVIEKFEENAGRAGFAVVLATADDLASTAKSLRESTKDDAIDRLQMRARQNVIFECGYFMAKLGRRRVMLVTEQGLEIPSDLSGIIYTPRQELSANLWKELREAGYQTISAEQISQATAIAM